MFLDTSEILWLLYEKMSTLLEENRAQRLKVSSPSIFAVNFWRVCWNHMIVLSLFIWPIPAFEVPLLYPFYNVLVWTQHVSMELLCRFYINNWYYIEVIFYLKGFGFIENSLKQHDGWLFLQGLVFRKICIPLEIMVNCNALLHAKGRESWVLVVFLGLFLHLGKCNYLSD